MYIHIYTYPRGLHIGRPLAAAVVVAAVAVLRFAGLVVDNSSEGARGGDGGAFLLSRAAFTPPAERKRKQVCVWFRL